MRIKKFEAFNESLMEGDSDFYKGNTKLSRWLRKIDANMEYEYDKKRAEAEPGGNYNGMSTINSVNSLLPLMGRLIASSGAAIADFFFKGDSKDSYSKLSKSELEDKKEDVLKKRQDNMNTVIEGKIRQKVLDDLNSGRTVSGAEPAVNTSFPAAVIQGSKDVGKWVQDQYYRIPDYIRRPQDVPFDRWRSIFGN